MFIKKRTSFVFLFLLLFSFSIVIYHLSIKFFHCILLFRWHSAAYVHLCILLWLIFLDIFIFHTHFFFHFTTLAPISLQHRNISIFPIVFVRICFLYFSYFFVLTLFLNSLIFDLIHETFFKKVFWCYTSSEVFVIYFLIQMRRYKLSVRGFL